MMPRANVSLRLTPATSALPRSRPCWVMPAKPESSSAGHPESASLNWSPRWCAKISKVPSVMSWLKSTASLLTITMNNQYMDNNAKIYLAGHRGLAGSALMRNLETKGYTNLATRTREELDLTEQTAVNEFFARERPEYVFLAAAKVGGIHANNIYPAEFIR